MNSSITIQAGMTYQQVQHLIEATWPLLTIVLFLPTPGFYKADQFVDDAYVAPEYVLTRRIHKPDPILISDDMAESTVHDLLYDTYYLESNIAYRYNRYGRSVPGANLDQQQETMQHWWDSFEQKYGRQPSVNDFYIPIQQ